VVGGLLGVNNLSGLGPVALGALPLSGKLIALYGGGAKAANVAVETIFADAIFKNEFGRGALPASPINTTRVDGAPLSFYGSSYTVAPNNPVGYTIQASTPAWSKLVAASSRVTVIAAQDYEDMLRYGVGDRKAWADLYVSILRSQGLVNADGSPMGVMTLMAASENGSGFLLRNGNALSALNGVAAANRRKGAAAPPTAYVTQTVFWDGNLPPAVNTPPWRYGFINSPDLVTYPNLFNPPQAPARINGQNDNAALAAGLGGAPNWWYLDYTVLVNPANVAPAGLAGLAGCSLYSPEFGWGGLLKSVTDYQNDLVDGSFLYALRPPGRNQKASFIIKPIDPTWDKNECGVNERILTMSVPIPNPAAAFTVTVTATSTPGRLKSATTTDGGIRVKVFWQPLGGLGTAGTRGPTRTGANGAATFNVPKLAKGQYKFTATAPGYADAVLVVTQN
jgi:hypothetical protein